MAKLDRCALDFFLSNGAFIIPHLATVTSFFSIFFSILHDISILISAESSRNSFLQISVQVGDRQISNSPLNLKHATFKKHLFSIYKIVSFHKNHTKNIICQQCALFNLQATF